MTMTTKINAWGVRVCLGVLFSCAAHEVAHSAMPCAQPKLAQVLALKAHLPELDLIDANSELDILAAPHPRLGGYWLGVSHVAPVGGHLLWYDCVSQRLTLVANTGQIQALRRVASNGKWAAMVRVDGRYVGTGMEVVTSRWFALNGKPQIPLLSVRPFESLSEGVESETSRTVRFSRPPPQVEVVSVVRVNGKVVARQTEIRSSMP